MTVLGLTDIKLIKAVFICVAVAKEYAYMKLLLQIFVQRLVTLIMTEKNSNDRNFYRHLGQLT